MIRKQERHAPVEPLNLDEAQLNTLISNLPAVAALFDKLTHGEHPDFWAVMTAISEMVAFYTKDDSNCPHCQTWLENWSEKKCRNCY